jgi:ABC-type multidrug transport system ATPase subunit
VDTSPPVVEARGLTKRYGSSVLAVDRLDLTVRAGEVYGFLGPNGAGKTTTLRMLVGLIRPTAGTARVAGRPPGHPEGLARVGSLVESPAFYPYLSGRDNLRAVADYAGASRGAVEGALEEVDLRSRAGDAFGTYSTGMKQRLGVAAALLKDPDLMILDEPTNGLDPQGMVEMRGLVRRLGSGRRAVLVSSHLLGEVEQTCDRVGVIRSGRLLAEGTVAELRGAAGLLVRAAPADGARRLLEQMLGAEAVRDAEDGTFRLSVEPGRAAEINRALVQGGAEVSELRPAERSLEEAFLALTGEAEAAS